MEATQQLYINNQNFIRSKAWEFQKKAPFVEFEEFESEANLVFTRCTDSYNPDRRVSFITYLGNALNRNLQQFLTFFFLDAVILEDIEYTEEYEDFEEWKNSLSFMTQNLIEIIFNAGEEILSPKNKITKESLYTYLRKTGWKPKEINFCFNEISLALEKIN